MKAAIVVVDMLNDFLGGALRCERAEQTLPAAEKFLEGARKKHIPVIFACDAHLKGIDRELALWGEHAVAGTEGAKICSVLGPEAGDLIVEKRRYSAFFQTHLPILLSELGVDTLVLMGIQAHICVQHTAADAYFYGYKVLLAEDLIEAFTAPLKEQALAYMAEMYGAERKSSEEILGML